MKVRARVAIGTAGALAVLAVSLTAASASIPDSSDVIHACYTTSSGALRVIDSDAGGSCYSYETAISWPSKAPSLKYFTGQTGKNSSNEITVTCPDGGIPVSLWWSAHVSGNNVVGVNNTLNNTSTGSTQSQQLVYPGDDNSKAPNGIKANSIDFPSGTIDYTIICS